MSRRRWLSLILSAGLVLAGTARTAGDGTPTTRERFESAARQVVSITSIPVYIPVSLQSRDAELRDGCVFVTSGSSSFSITAYGRLMEYGKAEPLPCEENPAAQIAGISGSVDSTTDYPAIPSAQKAALGNGTAAAFLPVRCGGSCAPAMLSWKTGEASYRIDMRFASTVPASRQLRELLDMADSLVLVPPGDRRRP